MQSRKSFRTTTAVTDALLIRSVRPWMGRRARSAAGIALATGMAFLSQSALALDPNLTIKQLHHTAWGPAQGAPLGGAHGFEQTRDGYLKGVPVTGACRGCASGRARSVGNWSYGVARRAALKCSCAFPRPVLTRPRVHAPG